MEDKRFDVNRPPRPPIGTTLALVANTLVHMMAAVVIFAVWRFVFRLGGSITKFHLHILFSATGYQLLLLEGAMCLHPLNSWSSMLGRDARRYVHLGLQILGSASVITGASLAISMMKPNNFLSAHGICGLIALIFSCLSIVNGFLTFFAAELRNTRPLLVKSVHTITGTMAVIMGLTTLCIGLNKTIFILLEGKDISVCCTIFVALSMTYIVMSPVVNLKRYLSNMRTTVL